MRARTWVSLGFAMLVAYAVRYAAIDARPLWLDEAYSHWFASLSLHDLWTEMPSYETHPPLYYTVLHFWKGIFGNSEPALRMPSLLCNVATVPVVFALGWMCAPRGKQGAAAMVAAVLFALWPIQVQHAVEARPYTMMTLAMALFCAAAVALVRTPSPDDSPPGRRAAWLLFVISGTASLWLHNTSVITIGLVGVALAGVLMLQERSWTPLWKVAAAGMVMIFFWLPYLPWFIVQSEAVTTNFWIQPLSIRHVVATFFSVFSADGLPDIALPWVGPGDYIKLALGIPLVALAAYGALRIWRERRWPSAAVLLTAAFAPFAAVVVISLLIRPIMLPRILMAAAVPFCVLVALGLVGMQNRTWRAVLLGGICGVFFMAVTNAFYLGDRGKEPWDAVAARVSAESLPGDAIWLYVNHNEIPFDYYFDHPERTRALPQAYPAPDLPNDYPLGILGVPVLSPRDLAGLDRELNSLRRVWLITRAGRTEPHQIILQQLIERHLRMRKAWRYGIITVQLFAMDTGPDLRTRANSPALALSTP